MKPSIWAGQFARVTIFQFSGHLSILTLKVSILKIDTFKVRIDTLRLKLKNAQKMKKMPRLLHARIGPAQIDGFIMRSSRPRPAEKSNEI